MFCHCRIKSKEPRQPRELFKGKPLPTEVNEEGICVHCGYYAMRHVLVNETRVCEGISSREESDFVVYRINLEAIDMM